jgi:hypothetical protein
VKNYLKSGLVVLVVLFLAISASTYAQESPTKSGIQISPLSYNFEINPGGTLDAKIILKNLNPDDLNYVAEVEGFTQTSDEGAPSFTSDIDPNTVTSIKSWFTFGVDGKGTILPGMEKEIAFTVTVPKDAEPGGHYAAVFGRQVKDLAVGSNEVGVTSRVGTLVLISVPGKVTNGAEIIEFIAPKYVWSGPMSFSMKVKNTGSVHYDAIGSFLVEPLLSKASNFELAKHTILPGGTRNFQKNWPSKYPFGYFKVTPTATDGANAQVTLPSVAIVAVPLIIVIPSLLGLILIILLVAYIRKHVKFVK